MRTIISARGGGLATDEARARVRAAESDDEAGVRSVLTQLFRSDHERFRHLDVRQGSRSFVAERNGEVVGFALAAWIDYGLPTETSGTIELPVVDERHRARGFVLTSAAQSLRRHGTRRRSHPSPLAAAPDASRARV